MLKKENEGKVLKRALQLKFGSLRAASRALDMNYYRLSNILQGWIEASKPEWANIKKAVASISIRERAQKFEGEG